MYCQYCGEALKQNTTGRRSKFCSGACRVAHHRCEKRYTEARQNVTKPTLSGQLILELFPGAGLFGKPFSEYGACVVRGPDILWGGDIHELRGIRGRFDGIIGGPPCQFASRAAIHGSKKPNLIPEFVRLIEECKPTWAIMENVREARPFAPNWDYVFLRDWDCGGKTHRRRGFWFYGINAPPAPGARPGTPEYSVLASNWNARGTTLLRNHLHLTSDQAADLQGFPALGQRIVDNQPGWKIKNGWKGVSKFSRECLAVHMLGNGVPYAVGNYLAEYVAYVTSSRRERDINLSLLVAV